jgi:hypothetical protein
MWDRTINRTLPGHVARYHYLSKERIMSDIEPNSDEGASPADDIKKQNPEGTTTGDQTGETGGDHKVEDLAKAGRDDMDTDEDAE